MTLKIGDSILFPVSGTVVGVVETQIGLDSNLHRLNDEYIVEIENKKTYTVRIEEDGKIVVVH